MADLVSRALQTATYKKNHGKTTTAVDLLVKARAAVFKNLKGLDGTYKPTTDDGEEDVSSGSPDAANAELEPTTNVARFRQRLRRASATVPDDEMSGMQDQLLGMQVLQPDGSVVVIPWSEVHLDDELQPYDPNSASFTAGHANSPMAAGGASPVRGSIAAKLQPSSGDAARFGSQSGIGHGAQQAQQQQQQQQQATSVSNGHRTHEILPTPPPGGSTLAGRRNKEFQPLLLPLLASQGAVGRSSAASSCQPSLAGSEVNTPYGSPSSPGVRLNPARGSAAAMAAAMQQQGMRLPAVGSQPQLPPHQQLQQHQQHRSSSCGSLADAGTAATNKTGPPAFVPQLHLVPSTVSQLPALAQQQQLGQGGSESPHAGSPAVVAQYGELAMSPRVSSSQLLLSSPRGQQLQAGLGGTPPRVSSDGTNFGFTRNSYPKRSPGWSQSGSQGSTSIISRDGQRGVAASQPQVLLSDYYPDDGPQDSQRPEREYEQLSPLERELMQLQGIKQGLQRQRERRSSWHVPDGGLGNRPWKEEAKVKPGWMGSQTGDKSSYYKVLAPMKDRTDIGVTLQMMMAGPRRTSQIGASPLQPQPPTGTARHRRSSLGGEQPVAA